MARRRRHSLAMDAVSQAAVLEERDREPLILRALVPVVAEPCAGTQLSAECAPRFALQRSQSHRESDTRAREYNSTFQCH